MEGAVRGRLKQAQSWLVGKNLEAIIVPSGDEYLSEFPAPKGRRLRWLTGFRGSTATLILGQRTIGLFLDPRYHLQGIAEFRNTVVAICPSDDNARGLWMSNHLRSGSHVGFDPRLHSIADVNRWKAICAAADVELLALSDNPVDDLWLDRSSVETSVQAVDHPEELAGRSRENKIDQVVQTISDKKLIALIVADPEDVSWLLNIRADRTVLEMRIGDWHTTPAFPGRAIVHANGGIDLFADPKSVPRELSSRWGNRIAIRCPSSMSRAIAELRTKGPVGAHMARTPASFISADAHDLSPVDFIAQMRWKKTESEITAARRAHLQDSASIVEFLSWLHHSIGTQRISEHGAAEKLDQIRRRRTDYLGPSMPLMSASGPNSAMPHYTPPRSGSRELGREPTYWMDSGGHYPGASTDVTVTTALSAPERRHIETHTIVLKAFVALASALVPSYACGLQLDLIARQILWRKGLDIDHGVGHGVGAYLNIHEGPALTRSPVANGLTPIMAGMIIANEPAYYLPNDFGIRLECQMVVQPADQPGFFRFELISRIPIDPNLVDFDMLTRDEIIWLAHYHDQVKQDLRPQLDPSCTKWLENYVAPFFSA